MTGQTLNGTKRPHVPTWQPFTPIRLGVFAAPETAPESAPAAEQVPAEDVIDLVAAAQAQAIRTRAEAEVEAIRIAAEAEAEAVKARAAEEARKQKLVNDKAEAKAHEEQIDREARIAKKAAETARAKADEAKAAETAGAEAGRQAQRAAEQQRSEAWWKWSARIIYGVGLAIAAPVQFLDFWDPKRPFLIAAPILLEGLALVLAFGAAWAVAHRRDVAPYRVGIMLGAMIAATINLRGGMTNPVIGFNAGLIGAIASLGGPVILMAYEHGIAQKADGIPSWRETRAADKEKAAEAAARDKVRADRKAAEDRAAAEKAAREQAAEAEQRRKDSDRQAAHEEVWNVAEAMRSARGSATVTEQIWLEAWHRVTGSKTVGITPEIETLSRAAQERMKAAVDGSSALVESQMHQRPRRDPDAPDGRQFNGGVPPLRTPGSSAPHHPLAKAAAAETARRSAVTASVSDASRKDV